MLQLISKLTMKHYLKIEILRIKKTFNIGHMIIDIVQRSLKGHLISRLDKNASVRQKNAQRALL